MFAACTFWIMKMTITVKAAKPAMNAVRIALIRARARATTLACGAGGYRRAPLAEGGSNVLVVPCPAGSVMALLPFRRPAHGARAVCSLSGLIRGRGRAGRYLRG